MLSLHRILNGIWLIEPSFAANYIPLVTAWLENPIKQSDKTEKEVALNKHNAVRLYSVTGEIYQISEYGEWVSPEDAPENSIAVISINGTITKYDQDCGPAGMQSKKKIVRRCCANDNIKGIVLDIDSGGGESYAMRELTSEIEMRNKPIIAFCNDVTASAAYGIAAACDKVIANSSLCQVGSIGTFMTIVDYTEYYKKMGIKLIDIYASKSTDKNQPYIKAIEGDTSLLREMCDKVNDAFIESIASWRSGVISDDRKQWSTGKLFFAEEAKKLGLIDEIDTFENVINYFNT